MIGRIDANGRALLGVEVRSSSAYQAVVLEELVDTRFTGELVLPRGTIRLLGLDRSGSVDAILADGSQIELSTFTCLVS